MGLFAKKSEPIELPVWRFCEVCGSPMEWDEVVGKYNPVKGSPEPYWYYRCSVHPKHSPQATEPGPFRTYLSREVREVRVPDR